MPASVPAILLPAVPGAIVAVMAGIATARAAARQRAAALVPLRVKERRPRA